jgi:hypothetical protein
MRTHLAEDFISPIVAATDAGESGRDAAQAAKFWGIRPA